MSLGEMKERIDLWERVSASNGIGGYTQTDRFITQVWSAVKWKEGTEEVEHAAEQEKRFAVFKIRERDFTKNTFIRFDGYEFEVSTFLPNDEGYLIITAEGEKYGS